MPNVFENFQQKFILTITRQLFPANAYTKNRMKIEKKGKRRRRKRKLTIKVFYTVDECLFIVFVLLVKQRLFS